MLLLCCGDACGSDGAQLMSEGPLPGSSEARPQGPVTRHKQQRLTTPLLPMLSLLAVALNFSAVAAPAPTAGRGEQVEQQETRDTRFASPAVASGCPHGRANVLDFGADPTGKNDSAPAFRAAVAACQAVYAPAGTYSLRTAEPSGKPVPGGHAAALQSGTATSSCPSDGHNCFCGNCTCLPGDGAPYNMAAGTKNKPCWACQKFLPPPTAFVDFGLATGSGGGGLIGDGPDVTIIEVRCSIDSRCFSKAVVHNIATILRLIGSI